MKNKIVYANIDEYYSLLSRAKHIPFFGSFELTPRCNMNCKMCYIRMNEEEMKKIGREMTVDEWLEIAQQATKRGMTHLLLTGGEPLVYKGFKELYLKLRKLGIFISVNTNGTMFTDEWVDFFAQNIPAQINITIYGGSNETYNRLCRNPKGFDQMKSTIEKLQSKNIRVVLNCVITKQNFEDMEEIFRFGREHDLKVNATCYCFPPVRKEGVIDPEVNRYNPKEAALARVYTNWNSINDKNTFVKRADYIVNYPEKVQNIENSCVDAVGDRVLCAAGRSNFWITWDGRMLPCGMIPDYSVSIKELGFDDAWDNVVDYTSNIRLSAECKNCKNKDICSPCAAKLKSETGVFDQKSKYMCEFTEEYIRLMGEAKKILEAESI